MTEDATPFAAHPPGASSLQATAVAGLQELSSCSTVSKVVLPEQVLMSTVPATGMVKA